MSEDPVILDRTYIGKEYSSSPKLVETESIVKYALATNEKNPLYTDRESPEGLVPPPLYPVVFLPELLSQLVDDAEGMGLDMLRVVHAEHEMEWRGTVRPGDQILSKAKIVNMERRGVNDILDLQIQCTREGTTVVEMQYRLMVRGKKKQGEKKPGQPPVAGEQRKKLAEGAVMVSDDQGVRYAEASGDHNPIHISDEIARSVGIPSAILHGLCTMALASQTIVDKLLGGDPRQLKRMKVRFSRPVLMGQTVTTEVYDAGTKEAGIQVVHFETRDAKGVPVLTRGVAEFIE
ncbi:MAG: MaoC/PaaZ C-terminal domain-containing protein [Candidatus Thorarchaeota archaeon]